MKKILFTITLFVSIATASKAQEIKGFKTEMYKNEYGNLRLKVTPNTFDGTKPKIIKTSGVYGVRFCYTQNGMKKAVLRDMTYKIVTKGEFEYGGWGSGKGVEVTNITFFSC